MIDFPDIEFHRQGYAMIADYRDKDPGAPICFPQSDGGRVMTGFCTCKQSRSDKSCLHFSELVRLTKEVTDLRQSRRPENREPLKAVVMSRIKQPS